MSLPLSLLGEALFTFPPGNGPVKQCVGAVVNVHRAPAARAWIAASGLEHYFLHEGIPPEDLLDLVPYVVELETENQIQGEMLQLINEDNVIFFRGRPGQDLASLTAHLVGLRQVKMPDGEYGFLRFHEPYVLDILLSSTSSEQREAIFAGKMEAFYSVGSFQYKTSKLKATYNIINPKAYEVDGEMPGVSKRYAEYLEKTLTEGELLDSLMKKMEPSLELQRKRDKTLKSAEEMTAEEKKQFVVEKVRQPWFNPYGLILAECTVVPWALRLDPLTISVRLDMVIDIAKYQEIMNFEDAPDLMLEMDFKYVLNKEIEYAGKTERIRLTEKKFKEKEAAKWDSDCERRFNTLMGIEDSASNTAASTGGKA